MKVIMDNITHGIVGSWIMDSVLGKSYEHSNASWRKRNKVMIVGGLVANIPDIDVFLGQVIPWEKPIDAFMFHRSFTHTFLFAFIVALVLGWWGSKKDTQQRPLWRWILATFLTISIGHLFVDYMTSYGIRWLLPFSSHTYSLGNIFVIDLFYSLPLIVLWLTYIFCKKVSQRRIVKIISWIWLCIYPLFTIITQQIITHKMKVSLDEKHISYSRVLVTAEPLQAFLWHGVAELSAGYYNGYYSLFDRGEISRSYIPNNTLVRKALQDKPDIQKVENFAQGWTNYLQDDGKMMVGMVKMGGILGWQRPLTGDAARFAFNVSATGLVTSQQGRGGVIGSSFGKIWHDHWQRVWGNK